MLKKSEHIITIYHGSDHVIDRPVLGVGNPHNDYGPGFYCTEYKDLACEWSCPTYSDGICNEYSLDLNKLEVLNLNNQQYSVLNWLALLVNNRIFDTDKMLVEEMKQLLLEQYLIPVENIDVIIGYRADDSYFSFARAFLEGSLSLRLLEEAFYLGELGNQVVLKSQCAFNELKFINSEVTNGELWHPKRAARDTRARNTFLQVIRKKPLKNDDIFAIDILRSSNDRS